MTSFSYSHRLPATHLAVLRRFTSDVPVKVGALAEALGLKVVTATLPLNISGLIMPDGEGGFIIKVNRYEPKDRQRFTIAHEIAHYLLHKDKISAGVVDSVLYRSKLSSRAEAEANKLAADIIMPFDAIRSEISSLEVADKDEQVIRLAEKFRVSKSAMTIRAG